MPTPPEHAAPVPLVFVRSVKFSGTTQDPKRRTSSTEAPVVARVLGEEVLTPFPPATGSSVCFRGLQPPRGFSGIFETRHDDLFYSLNTILRRSTFSGDAAKCPPMPQNVPRLAIYSIRSERSPVSATASSSSSSFFYCE